MANSSAQAKTHTIVEHGQSHLIMKLRSSLDLSLDSGYFLVFSNAIIRTCISELPFQE